MSLNSVNTNVGAMVALQSLNRTNAEMATVQKRISTGLRVADARDDGAAFAVAERVRGDMAATQAANQQLGGTKGLLDVARAGLENVSETLKNVRTTIVRLADERLSADERTQYQNQLKDQVNQIKNFLADAKYNGQTILMTDVTAGAAGSVKTIRNGDGDAYEFNRISVKDSITTQLENLVATGSTGLMAAGNTGAANARTALGAGGDLTKAVNGTLTALNAVGGYSRYVDSQIEFNKSRMDAQEAGLGALIDADLAKESARLQALQIRQQLGSQSLGIANQAPQVLLSLFR